MTLETKPLTQVNQEAIEILYREMGVVNAVRFLNQFTTGYGDYTAERDTFFADVTLDEIIADIKREQAQENGPQP
jgi:hypothetical protein